MHLNRASCMPNFIYNASDLLTTFETNIEIMTELLEKLACFINNNIMSLLTKDEQKNRFKVRLED